MDDVIGEVMGCCVMQYSMKYYQREIIQLGRDAYVLKLMPRIKVHLLERCRVMGLVVMWPC